MEWLKRNWRKVALFALAGLAAGFAAVGQPEIAGLLRMIQQFLGL